MTDNTYSCMVKGYMNLLHTYRCIFLLYIIMEKETLDSVPPATRPTIPMTASGLRGSQPLVDGR